MRLPMRLVATGVQAMTDEDRKKLAAVLAAIAKLPKDATFEDFNRQRLTIIIPEKQKLN
jgi:hypothetical protein